MDRDRLTRLIDDPSGVQRGDITDLKAMAERYPWFSGAHLLLAVGGHREGDVLFDEQLRTSAAHLPSRAVLFDMIHAPVVTEQRPEVVRSFTLPTSIPVLEETPEAPETEPEPPSSDPVAPAEPAALATEPTPISPPSSGPPEAAPEITDGEHVDALDKQILNAAVASSYELLIEHTPNPSDPIPEGEQPAVALEPVAAPAVPVTGRMRFSDWLSIEGTSPSPAPVSAQPPSTTVQGGDTSDTKALIAQFVQQSQVAKTKRAEFFNPQQAAKRSLEDHADLVTETLARIYANQGNFNKALIAYQRLAAKHPERAEYFLAQARALEGGSS